MQLHRLYLGFILSLLVSTSSFAQGLEDLHGLYEGKIKMWETNHETKIRIALNLLDEVDPDTDELMHIVGVFVIDDEGGPYRFSKISLDTDTGRVDMRYTRPNRTRILNSPSHFRLVGELVQSDPLKIRGKVLSGFYGPVGEFEVQRAGGQTSLVAVPKYFGRWSGFVDFRVGRDPFQIILNTSATQTINPDDFEFDFTNSKIGSMVVRDQAIGFTSVYIDYLRGILVLINGTPGMETTVSMITTLDPATGNLKGFVNSSQIGQNGSFTVAPTKQ